jgi:hypothetical protein
MSNGRLSVVAYVVRFIPVLLFGLGFFAFSKVIRLARKVGSLIVVRRLTYLPFRLLFTPTSAQALREDLLMCMDPAIDALIDEHYGEGYAKRLVYETQKEKLHNGDYLERERLSTGEFGVSLVLTGIALGTIYYNPDPALSRYISVVVGVSSLILLFAVGVRTKLMDTLAYQSSTNHGSLTEDTGRFIWNSYFLSRGAPVATLLILKIASWGGSDFYRLTVHSVGVGMQRAVERGSRLSLTFPEVFFPDFWRLAYGEDMSEDIPPAEAFEYT